MLNSSVTSSDAPICLAITGASGAQYGLRLLEQLLRAERKVYLLISKAARMVIATETDWQLPAQRRPLIDYLAKRMGVASAQLEYFQQEQWTAPVASGSAKVGAMVICPCSTGTLSAVASGACNNLIERAADVSLKERRRLILVPREAPYSQLHLENMLKLNQMGACILPASPGFYQGPETIEDLVDFVVARILNLLDIPQNLLAPWGADHPPEE